MMVLDPEAGFLRLLAGLDRLEIRYMVTGSAASSSYGVWRATNDVDIVVDLRQEQVADFVSEFESSFYIAREQVEQAIRLGRSFNLIHLGSFYKSIYSPFERTVSTSGSSHAASFLGWPFSARISSSLP